MIRRPPRSTRTDTLFPTRRSSDLHHLVVLRRVVGQPLGKGRIRRDHAPAPDHADVAEGAAAVPGNQAVDGRSEEHTSELQSLMRISYAVFCLKKTIPINTKQDYD